MTANHTFEQLLILMVVIWAAAVLLRKIKFPTVIGELVMGVIVGPAVLGWVEPTEVIEILAQMGIFFLMLHTGVETEPRDFFSALRDSFGLALVGALVPFAACFFIALAFGEDFTSALFVGLTMTATAVVITIKILRDLGLQHTRMSRVIVASCMIDDLITLMMFSMALGIVQQNGFNPQALIWIGAKTTLFFAVVIAIGNWMYPLMRHPFRNREGKGFTFVLILALGFGLLAEAIGLHIIIGAYLAGLFFGEKVASTELVVKVKDRLSGIAYSFLGPIFFISLGFHVTFDALTGGSLIFVLALTGICIVGQILSAGGMARLMGFTHTESFVIGVGMCGRAEMAFVLASLGLTLGAIGDRVFSILIFTVFLLNILVPLGLKACATMLRDDRAAYPEIDPAP